MNKFEKFILKKRNIWVHILLTIFTYYIWLIVYFVTKAIWKFKQEKINKENVKRLEYLKSLVVFDDSFNVAGISYHEKELNKNINYLLERELLVPYNELTNKEIIDGDYNISIYGDQEQSNIKLVPTKFEDKDSIEVHLTTDEDLLIGNVPKEYVNKIYKYLNNKNYKYTIKYYINGGKTKKPVYDYDTDKTIIDTLDLNYGIKIYLKISKKEQ